MPSSQKYTCPVCGYPNLTEPAYDQHGCASFDICPSCGTEFGYDDATRSHEALRKAWLDNGGRWNSQSVREPAEWNPIAQLRRAGLQVFEDLHIEKRD